MMSALRVSGYFDCQGNNSLNFSPIFKILEAKHISASFDVQNRQNTHVACGHVPKKVGPNLCYTT